MRYYGVRITAHIRAVCGTFYLGLRLRPHTHSKEMQGWWSYGEKESHEEYRPSGQNLSMRPAMWM